MKRKALQADFRHEKATRLYKYVLLTKKPKMGYIEINYTHNARRHSAIMPGRVQGIKRPENHARTMPENIFSAPNFWGDIFFENFPEPGTE